MSDVSESLANSSALSEVDDGDYGNELTQLKQDIEVKTWLLHYDLKEFKHFKKLSIK